MKTHLVLTVLGQDRPGIVGALADVIAARGGNWLESRMCNLGGAFAGIVRVEAERESLAELRAALGAMERDGLAVTATDEAAAAGPLETAEFEIVGHDQPGIIRAITGALAARGANVEELESEVSSAPMSGEPIFTARLRVGMPGGIDGRQLRADLEKVAADWLVTLRF